MLRFLLRSAGALLVLLAAQGVAAGAERAKLGMDFFSKKQLSLLNKEIKYISYWDSYAKYCGFDLDFVQRARAVASPCLTDEALDGLQRLYRASASRFTSEITKTIKDNRGPFCSLANPSTKRPFLTEAKELIARKVKTLDVLCRTCLWCGKD